MTESERDADMEAHVELERHEAELEALRHERDTMRYERDAARAIATRMRDTLCKIAFPAKHGTNDLAGNASRWSTSIAYVALGGTYHQGTRADTEEDLRSDWWE